MTQLTHLNTTQQRGAALFIMLLVLILAVSGVFISTTNPYSREVDKKQKSNNALVIAKQALIAYAATHYEAEAGQFGLLPCPDMTTAGTEGEQDGNCGPRDVNAVGRLPWRTLDLGPLKDIEGECLWYAVSGPYKKTPESTFLNADVPGLFALYADDGATLLAGTTPDTRPVAMIFSPGLPIGQNRVEAPANDVPNCGGSYDATLYLEAVGISNNAVLSGNTFEVDEIARGAFTSETTINDKVLYISKADIWEAVQARSDYIEKFRTLTEQVALCIAEYGSHNADGELRLPWAAPLGPFAGATGYHNDNNYDDSSALYAGRIPFLITDSVAETNSNYPELSGPGTEILFEPPIVGTDCERLLLDIIPPLENEIYHLWKNWREHLFYAVSQARSPASTAASTCLSESCLTINGGGQYAAVVLFAGTALTGQIRTGPPDADTRSVIANYLEGNNDVTLQSEDGDGDYTYRAADNIFNDILYCIDENLIVAECPIL